MNGRHIIQVDTLLSVGRIKMEEEIIIPDKRKTKNDKKAKKNYTPYKKGGHSRVDPKPKDL